MTKEIRLPAPHPRFRPRLEGDLRRPGHPGTAVRMDEDIHEVVAVERNGDDWVYRLEPWPDGHVIRALVEWGEDSAREFTAGLRQERIRGQKNFWTWTAQAVLGFLPAENQARISEARGMDPARATFWSAALESLASLPFAFMFLIETFAGGVPGASRSVPAWVGLLAAVALGDGLFRLVAVISTGEPVGSLYLVFLRFRLRSEAPPHDAGDEVLETEEALSIVSPVPKAWWERAGGVIYKGEPYILAGRDRQTNQYCYRFRRGGGGFPVLDPELEKARNRSSDRSYVFAILWGFLSRDLQEALEFYGRYRPRPNVLISIGLTALVALAFAGPGLKSLSRSVFEPVSLALLAIALFLFAECATRLLRLLTEGRTSGSVLGLLVRPLYDRAFKDRPDRMS
jgi:hypothetical protein